MEKQTVSAIITTYKRPAAMLRECLDSVVGQTYPLAEIIVVDDNPPDFPEKANIKALESAYPGLKVIAHATNQGAQRARNDGIRASVGDFVAFLDDDDIWLPEKIEKQMPYFSAPDVGLVYCRGYQCDTDTSDHSTPYFQYFSPECTHRTLLAFDDIGTTSQAVIRKTCFDVVGYFDEEMPARQDYEMWLRITTKYRAVGSPDFLFVRRMHAQGQISRSRDRAQKGAMLILKKYRADYRADRTIRALGYWQIGSHQVFEHTWFRFKYRLLALLSDPAVILKRIRGRRYVQI